MEETPTQKLVDRPEMRRYVRLTSMVGRPLDSASPPDDEDGPDLTDMSWTDSRKDCWSAAMGTACGTIMIGEISTGLQELVSCLLWMLVSWWCC